MAEGEPPASIQGLFATLLKEGHGDHACILVQTGKSDQKESMWLSSAPLFDEDTQRINSSGKFHSTWIVDMQLPGQSAGQARPRRPGSKAQRSKAGGGSDQKSRPKLQKQPMWQAKYRHWACGIEPQISVILESAHSRQPSEPWNLEVNGHEGC